MNLIKIIKPASVIIFILGIAVLGYSYQNARAKSNLSFQKDIKVEYTHNLVNQITKSTRLLRKVQRLQKANGNFKEIITYYDEQGNISNTAVHFSINGKGFFSVDENNKKLKMIGETPAQPLAFSEETAKKSNQYIGEGTVLGFKTLISRIKTGNDSYFEIQASPEFNGLWVKWIDNTDTKNEYSMIAEATNIKVENISDEEFGQLPNYEIDRSSVQKRN